MSYTVYHMYVISLSNNILIWNFNKRDLSKSLFIHREADFHSPDIFRIVKRSFYAAFHGGKLRELWLYG